MGRNKKNKRKVVYNDCYGGFSLSPEAIILYFKLKNPGKEVYIYNVTREDGYDIYTKTTQIPEQKSFSLDHVFLSEDYGETFKFGRGEKDLRNPRYKKFNDAYIYYGSDIPRHDPDLVRVVEKLGERASGSCSCLKVKDIGDSPYHIDEYDGAETVITQLDDDYWK